MQKTLSLPRADFPEQEGVSSKKLAEFFEKLDGTKYHGFMLIKNGKVVAERYRTPYDSLNPHALYSVSKTFTATAVGFAVSEGLVTLDTKIADIFPEYKPKKNDPYFEKMTLGHLITLSSGFTTDPAKNKSRNKDWMKIFMSSKRSFMPGEGFEYNNENFYVACAVIKKVTGKSVVDYLYPRLFEPLGIEKPFWETCHDGVESGGWGLFLSMEDLAKVGICYLNGGRYGSVQVIPEAWVKEALLNHKGEKYNKEFADNYGCGIWLRHNKNSFRFEGMFTQFAEMYPDHNALTVVIGGDSAGAPLGVTANAFPELLEEEIFDCDEEAFAKISSKKGNETFLPYPASRRSETEKRISGKAIRFRPHLFNRIVGLPLSVLPIQTVFMTKDRAGNISECSLDFADDRCVFSWREGDEKNSAECGLDGEYKISPMTLAGKNYNIYSSARWTDENTLEILIRPIESIDARRLVFTFAGNRVRMKPSSETTIEDTVSSIRWFIKNITKSDKLTDKICAFLCNRFEPVHYGKIKR